MKKIYRLNEYSPEDGSLLIERHFTSMKKAKKWGDREIKHLKKKYIRYYQGFGDAEIKNVPEPDKWKKCEKGYTKTKYMGYTFEIEKIYLNSDHS